MWIRFLLIGGMLGYVVYRLGLTIAAIRAERAGDAERAQSLRARAFWLQNSTLLLLTLGFVVVVLIAT